MQFPFIHLFKLISRHEPAQVAETIIHVPLHDASEGSEYLDDALREEDLSFSSSANTEDDATGSSTTLL